MPSRTISPLSNDGSPAAEGIGTKPTASTGAGAAFTIRAARRVVTGRGGVSAPPDGKAATVGGTDGAVAGVEAGGTCAASDVGGATGSGRNPHQATAPAAS